MNLRRRALGAYRADSARSPRAPCNPSQIQFWKIIGRLKFSVDVPTNPTEIGSIAAKPAKAIAAKIHSSQRGDTSP